MSNLPLLNDLRLLCIVARRASFIATADEVGASSAYVTKRIAILEKTLGLKLFDRTTRRVKITEEGETVYQWAREMLDLANGLGHKLGGAQKEIRGMVRITAGFRLGRLNVAPILSLLLDRHPGLELSLELVDRPVDLARDNVDIDIRLGEVTDPNVIAHRILASNRILCAAPSYLERHGTPTTILELAQHACLVLRERDHAFGTWQLRGPNGLETIKATGYMATNNADVARIWAHAGHGILLFADRDVEGSLKTGELIRVLPDYSQPADVWAVCRTRLSQSAKLKTCVSFLQEQLTNGPYALISSGIPH